MPCGPGEPSAVGMPADGIPNLMELNPLAGIHPEHSDLPIICSLYGISYPELMNMIMESALSRVKKKPKEKTRVV